MFCVLRCIDKVYTNDDKILFDNSMEYFAQKNMFPNQSITVYRHEIIVYRTGITVMLNEKETKVDEIEEITIEEFDIEGRR
ncbi:MAG: hypothetical protein ACE364_04865 [Chlorobiota bacterium]